MAAQLSGGALFICGAGVSMTAGLPSFRHLVEKVYRTLDQDWTGYPSEAGAMDEAGPYSGQYDRMLRSLERRLAASDTRASLGMRKRLLLAVASHLRVGDGAGLPNHEALLELSRGKDGIARLLTTNFDMEFERAGDSRNERIESHAGPSLPRPGTAAFEGVLHIHGRIGDDTGGRPATDLVLSSADFGEAYLRAGWAARYVYDLSRAFTLVLVGYAADDPPMRYLLEVLEADRARYPDLKPVYAFAPTEAGREREEREIWLSKGILPIPYGVSSEGSHEALYATLRAWRDFADAPTTWRRRRLGELAAKPSSLSNAVDVEQVASLLSHGDAWELLLVSSLPSGWWRVLNAHPVFERRAELLGAWIASRLDDPEMLASCAAHPPQHVDALERIGAALWRGSPELNPEDARHWRLLVSQSPDPMSIGAGWYRIEAQVRRGHLDPMLRERAVGILRPFPILRAAMAYDSDDGRTTSPVSIDFRSCEEVSYRDLLACWPADPGETWSLLRAADRSLSAALDEASDLGWIAGFDRSSYDVHNVSSDDGSMLEQRFFNLTRLVAVLWDRLSLSNSGTATAIARSWAAGPQTLKRRLFFHALACPAAFGGDEVGEALSGLSDRELWVEDTRREVRRLCVTRWAHLAPDIRRTMEAKLAAGPPERLRQASPGPGPDWRALVDHMVSEALGALRDAGCELGRTALDALLDAASRTGSAGESAGPATEDGTAPGIVAGELEGGDVGDRMDGEVLAEALRMRKAVGRWRTGAWESLCRDEPRRALDALERSRADGDEWPPETMQEFLGGIGAVDDTDLRRRTADLIASIPVDARDGHAYAVASWLSAQASRLVDTAGPGWDRFAGLWRTFVQCAKVNTNAPRVWGDADPMLQAGISAAGLFARALISALQARRSLGVAVIDQNAEEMLDALLELGGEPGLHARMQLASQIAFLERVAPRWCVDGFAPLLDRSGAEAPALWLARSHGAPTGPALFNRTKPGFMRTISACVGPSDNARGLAGLLVHAVLQAACEPESLFDLRSAEVKAVLAVAAPDLRHWMAWSFCRLVAQDGGSASDRAERWKTRVRPAFDFAWPLDAAARQPASLRDLARLPFECGDAFADAVDAVADMLAPFDVRSIDALFLTGDPCKRAAADAHPPAFLKLSSPWFWTNGRSRMTS